MALTYNLYFRKKTHIIELVKKILIKKEVQYTEKVSGESICIDMYNAWGYLIYIFFNSNQHFDYRAKDSYVEYEWKECTCISFDVNKFFDNSLLKSNILEITVILLKEISMDAVLLFNNDSLILDKVNNVVSINEKNDFWKQEDLIRKINKEL